LCSVHEAHSAAHFVAIFAQLMRQILAEYARAHGRAKRDGGVKLELDEALAFRSKPLDLVAPMMR